MKKICTFAAVLAVILLFTGTSFATGLLTEDFSYTAGTNLTANGWTINSGTGGISVATSGLSYSGLQGSGVGLAAQLLGPQTEDNYKTFTLQSSGTVYASFMINVSSIGSTVGDYFANFGTGTSYFAKVHARADATSGIDFGISKSANTTATTVNKPIWTSGVAYNTTHLIVIKYTFVAGTLNDQVDLWVDPTAGSSEPTATLTQVDATAGDATNIGFFQIRQSSSTTTPICLIDGIKVGTAWADVTPSSTPSLSAAPSSITGLTYITGAGPSASQSYTLTGANLTGYPGNITVSASTNFEVSNDNSTWSGTSVNVPYTSATLSAPVYVRLKAGLSIASYGPENIANAGGGATTMNVPVSGTVEPSSQLTVSSSTLTGFAYYFGSGPSASQSYNLSGVGLTGFPGVITITGSTNYEVSTDNASFGSSKTVAYTSSTLASTPIYVRLKSGLAVGNYNSEIVTNAGGGAPTENVTCSGSIVQQTLTVTASTSVSLSYVLGTGPSATTTYSVSGANLSGYPGNITVTAPSNFEITVDSISWGSSKTIAYTSGTLAATKVFVRLVSGLAINTYSGTLSFAGGGATTQNVTLNGFVTAGGLLFSDDFSYATGNLAGQDGWVAHSSIGTNPIQVVSPGLTYAGLTGSGVGNAISMASTGGEDCNHQFANQPLPTSGTVYASAMVNVTSSTATGDYFIHFSDGGTFNFYARTFIITNGAGFSFGISKYNGVKAYETTVRNYGETYFIVLKYNAVAGATNDYCNLFINPALGGSEPAADLTTDALLVDASNISGVFLRQGGSSSAPAVKVDGIKVGQTWASVTPAAGCTLNLTALFEAMYVAGGTAMLNPVDATVELHDGSSLAVVESKTATLSTAGVGSFLFTTATSGTPYYIGVKSANSVETWSANTVSFTGGALTYNFTTGTDKAYTDGSNPSEPNYGGVYCIYSGDVNQDGYVTADDYTGVDNDNTNFDYHAVNDVNGDGYVTADDYTFIDNNNTLFVQRQVPPGAPGNVKHAIRTVKSPVVKKSSVN